MSWSGADQWKMIGLVCVWYISVAEVNDSVYPDCK